MNRIKAIVLALAVSFPAAAYAGPTESEDACARISSAFAKIWTATVECRFPKTDEMARPIAAVYIAAEHACGGVSREKWAGAPSGKAAFEEEVREKGKTAVCKRIRAELAAASRK